jgi:hypothetical protein
MSILQRGDIAPQDLDAATSMILVAVIRLIDTRILGRIPGHPPPPGGARRGILHVDAGVTSTSSRAI